MEPKIEQIAPPSGKEYVERLRGEPPVLVFMTANPKDTQVLNINKEFTEIQEELETGKMQQCKLRLRLDVSRGQLVEYMLRDRPSVLHFSGHGTPSQGLVFQDEQGYTQMVAPEALGALLREFADSLQCVVLNACYSEAQARMVAQHVPNVIGTDNAIGDAKAIEFARVFYLCLFNGESYESAFRKAVVHCGIQELSAGAQPILYRWGKAVEMAASGNHPTTENKPQPPAQQQQEEQFTDPRNGKTYSLRRMAGCLWMAQNFDYDNHDDNDCCYYDDQEKYGAKYGALYRWESAQRLAPPGWRLPTKAEWLALLTEAGGYRYYSERAEEWKENGSPEKAGKNLLAGGNLGFQLRQGGAYEEEYGFNYLEESGCYWCADEFDAELAQHVCFEKEEGPYIQEEWKSSYFSVVYVKIESH